MLLSETTRARAFAAASATLAFLPALWAQGWPRDDRWLVLEHPLIRAGVPAARELLTSGYVEPVMGAETPIHQWRPVLSLTFLLNRLTTGFDPLPFRAVNLALHALAAILVLECLRRRLSARAALAGALLFAVLPVHAESIVYISSRSELLAGCAVLAAWLLLGGRARPSARRIAAGAAVYLLGSLSKEHALLFPAFLALSDFAFERRLPWSPERRRVYLALAGAAACVLVGRALVLPALAHGGVPYFQDASPLVRILTLSRFWVRRYLFPLATGTGLCSDFARPLIPDAPLDDAAAWAALAAVVAGFAWAVLDLARGGTKGFWLLGPCLFLAPTSHLFMNLDTLGAQRWLYLPSIGLAAGAGALFARLEPRAPRLSLAALAILLLGHGAGAAARSLDWRTDEAYYRAVIACNPFSSKGRSGLGLAKLRAGLDGRADLEAALRLDPRLYDAGYNLARLAWARGDMKEARLRLERARVSRPDAPDGLELQALLDERAGELEAAENELTRALTILPGDPVALFNRARVRARRGHPVGAAADLEEFLRRAPNDADAPAARRFLNELRRTF